MSRSRVIPFGIWAKALNEQALSIRRVQGEQSRHVPLIYVERGGVVMVRSWLHPEYPSERPLQAREHPDIRRQPTKDVVRPHGRLHMQEAISKDELQ